MTHATFKSLPQLLEKFQGRQARMLDIRVPLSGVEAASTTTEVMNEEGIGEVTQFVLQAMIKGESCDLAVMAQALPQLAVSLKLGGRQLLPGAYLTNLVSVLGDQAAIDLAADSVNEFKQRRVKEVRTNKRLSEDVLLRLEAKRPIVDPVTGQPLDGVDLSAVGLTVRAVLSARYMEIDHQVVLEVLMQMMSNDSYAMDASSIQVFDWGVTDKRMDVCVMNPTIGFDLKNPDKGVFTLAPKKFDDNSPHSFVTPGGQPYHLGGKGPTDTHLVFPAARARNSETGHSSFEVTGGLYEAICNNKAMIGQVSSRRHVGRLMQVDERHADVTLRRRQLISAELEAAFKDVFDRDEFEVTCRKFAGLFTEEVGDVRQELEAQIVQRCQLPTGLVDLALKAYAALGEKDTKGDVQRAITNAAQSVKDLDLSEALVDAGGSMLR